MKVLLIAPYKGLAELIKSMEHELWEFTISIHVADLDESKRLLNEYKRSKESFDVIISRGGTAKVLRESTAIPVIDIDISGYDILRILTLLKSYHAKIGMVGFKNVIYSFEAVSSVINVDVEYRVVKEESEVIDTLKELKEQGIQIIVGDAVTVKNATALGVQGVLITSGKESVYEAFNKAKRLKYEISKYSSRAELFDRLLNQLTNPVTLLAEDGEVIFANTALRKQFSSIQQSNFLALHPNISIALKQEMHDYPITFFVSDSPFRQPYRMNIGRVSNSALTVYNFIEFERSDAFDKSEAEVIFYDSNMENIPQLIASDALYHDAINTIIQTSNNNPFTIVGERGTGKRMLLRILWESPRFKQGTITEISFNHPSTSTFNRVMTFLGEFNEQDIVHFCFLEKLTSTQQKRLAEAIEHGSFQSVFSMVGGEERFIEVTERFQQDLKKMIKQFELFFPPLRSREENLEHYIHTFILYFNELYGKQVIGLEKEAMVKLLNYPWYGNMIELRKVVKRLVQRSSDVYIKHVEQTLKEVQNEPSYGNGIFVPINLQQTMEGIERDVIKEVYRQEGENQSKTAKRLGMNRSTLWRKMNRSIKPQ
jgi:transcriptional regulator with PAS, ATPase and Fis domain